VRPDTAPGEQVPSLLVKEGPLAGKVFPVTGELVLGRANADITLDDVEVSRRHARIEARDGELMISDLDSANGTEVNGELVDRPRKLSDGDLIRLGDTLISAIVPGQQVGATVLRQSPGTEPTTLVLVGKDGPIAGQRFTIERELVIGRAGADITVKDPEISRRHARIRPVNGGIEVTDLDSSNGTVVNGVRIGDATMLDHGDVIKVGHTSLEAEITAPNRANGPQSTVSRRRPTGAR
jgi:S-DNA-T family DNA segregation ATPase FtsK/SpoIIIE